MRIKSHASLQCSAVASAQDQFCANRQRFPNLFKVQGTLFRGHHCVWGPESCRTQLRGGCSQVLKKWPKCRGVCLQCTCGFWLLFSEGSAGVVGGVRAVRTLTFGEMGPGSGPQPLPPPPITGLICMPCCGPVASPGPCPEAPGAHHTEQLPPASLLLAMAWWRLALLLIGALLAGELSLGLVHLGVGWGTALAPEGPSLQRSKLR